MAKNGKNATTDLTTTAGAALPAGLLDRAKQDAGKGVSTDQADSLVPLIYILQTNSPQCNPRDPQHIDGAQPGCILLRAASEPVIDGEDGMLFQPCFFYKDLLEWVPRSGGGGFVGAHAELPSDAEKVVDPNNPNKVKWARRNGNEIIETRHHVGFVHLASGARLPYVLPMSSTGHTASRQWTFSMKSKLMPADASGNQEPYPSWAGLYRLKTRQRTNALGTWFTWEIEDAGFVQSLADYERGAALHEAFASGMKKAEAPAGAAEFGADAGGPEGPQGTTASAEEVM